MDNNMSKWVKRTSIMLAALVLRAAPGSVSGASKRANLAIN
jgi:hypothetical protein